MANYNLPTYVSGADLVKPTQSQLRWAEKYIDLSKDVTMTTNTDTVGIFQFPKGSLVIGGLLEQITAGSAGNTLQLRVGTTAVSATLASDAAAGTYAASATSSLPVTVTTAADLNLLSASGIRTTGIIRVGVFFIEGYKKFQRPGLAQRDFLA